MSKRSIVWEHFDINPVDNSNATCRHCDASVSRGGAVPSSWSTSALTKHLSRCHPFVNLTKAAKDGSSSSQLPQPDIKASFDRGKAWDFNDSRSLTLHRAVAEMIAVDDQPFSVVNNVGFRRLMQLMEPRYTLPSDSYLRRTAIPDLYKHLSCLAPAILTSQPAVDNSPQKMYAIMSFSYLGAMLCSNHALQFISYPTQVLGKSVKPIPVMILGVLLAHKKYPWLKYLFVLMITTGVAMFMYKPSKAKAVSDTSSMFGWGELLLLLSLSLDGVTGGVQDKLRSEHQTQTHRMMLSMNVWSILYLSLGLVLTGEGLGFVTFVMKYPSVLIQLITFSLCSAIGQNFIFLTVTYFGPLTCSVITTTRKFFTILGSVLIFQHPLTTVQWSGTVLVFAGLSLDSAFGKSDKHKTTGQKNDVGGDIDKMVNSGYVSEHDTLQQTQDKLKPM